MPHLKPMRSVRLPAALQPSFEIFRKGADRLGPRFTAPRRFGRSPPASVVAAVLAAIAGLGGAGLGVGLADGAGDVGEKALFIAGGQSARGNGDRIKQRLEPVRDGIGR